MNIRLCTYYIYVQTLSVRMRIPLFYSWPDWNHFPCMRDDSAIFFCTARWVKVVFQVSHIIFVIAVRRWFNRIELKLKYWLMRSRMHRLFFLNKGWRSPISLYTILITRTKKIQANSTGKKICDLIVHRIAENQIIFPLNY